MELLKILNLAEALNYQLVNHDASDGFYTYFVKDNEVKGLVRANASGYSYQLPEDLKVITINLLEIMKKRSEPLEGDYIPDPNPEC